MGQGDPPAGDEDPDHVAEQREDTRGRLLDDLATEGPGGVVGQPERRDAPRDGHDQQAADQPRERVREPEPQTAEDEPDDVEQRAHEINSRWPTMVDKPVMSLVAAGPAGSAQTLQEGSDLAEEDLGCLDRQPVAALPDQDQLGPRHHLDCGPRAGRIDEGVVLTVQEQGRCRDAEGVRQQVVAHPARAERGLVVAAVAHAGAGPTGLASELGPDLRARWSTGRAPSSTDSCR